MLLLVSFAGSSSCYDNALGLSPWASCFLCTHALVISFSLLPTKTIQSLMVYISNLDPSPECQTPILDFILDLSMGTSNRHLKLTMSQMEPLNFLQTCSTHSYPVSMDIGWQIPSFSVAMTQYLGVNVNSFLALMSHTKPVCQQVLFSPFSKYNQNPISPHLHCFHPVLSHHHLLLSCKSHLTGLPTLLLAPL